MDKIRPIERRDYEELLLMFQEFATFQKAAGNVQNSVGLMEQESEYLHGYVIEAESGELAGYVTFFYAYFTWSGKSIYLDDLYVKPAFRKKGWGKKLLLSVIDKAGGEGCKKVHWQVSKWNEHAIDFYKSLGAIVDDVELNCDYWLRKTEV
jgi:GNAT superfamily N-acetyltransferase